MCGSLFVLRSYSLLFSTYGSMQINIESRVKNIRFLAELAKFRVCPSQGFSHYSVFLRLNDESQFSCFVVVFKCWYTCLVNFQHHQITVACSMLEVCGGFVVCS